MIRNWQEPDMAKDFIKAPGYGVRLQLLMQRPRIIALDYDGTLAELAPTPAMAGMPRLTLKLLAQLAAQPQTRAAIISGRPLEDLKARLPVSKLVLVGNHGLSCSDARLGFQGVRHKEWEKIARDLARALLEFAAKVPGSLVEYKGIDLALHYRLADPRRLGPLLRKARELAHAAGFDVRIGKAALELRPKTQQNKGTALKRLAVKLALGWRKNGCLLYAGDDATDEDAFRAAKTMGSRALTIKIGLGKTCADWRMPNPAALQELLIQICRP
jgi:trehalose-phosphatase